DKILNCRAESIEKIENGFCVNNKLFTKNIFFATGSDCTMGELSLDLLRHFGHTVKEMRPSLVWLKTDQRYIKGLDGLRAKAKVCLLDGGKKVALQTGEILFKKEGLSGIAVLMLSAYVARNNGKYRLSIDFAWDMAEEEIKKYDLEGVVRKEIALNIKKQAKDRNISVHTVVKDFILEVTALGEKKYSQVANGGFELKDINSKTMQSKLVRGLYIGGECMDVDGQCGGYNLHWAFASAMAAMDNMVFDR
ncbi:MAG: NAD(P)/FAD-dependent oxidoreductase, partial [Bacillota bacterium]